MEQLFTVVNSLLRADPHTRKRNLTLRSYKVCLVDRSATLGRSRFFFVVCVFLFLLLFSPWVLLAFLCSCHAARLVVPAGCCGLVQVVPLTPVVGVTQWVENTTTIGSYLTGRGGSRYPAGAHARYAPPPNTINNEGRGQHQHTWVVTWGY